MSSKCPCCSSSLLRHWKHNKVYWFCSHCRQEMPNLHALEKKSYYHKQEKILNETISFSQQLVTLNSSKHQIVAT